MTKPTVRVQAPPGGWTDAEEKKPQTIDDFAGAVWDSTILNENLNSEQEALERAYDLLQKRGEALGMQGLYNPFRADQGGGGRQPLGSAARFLWRDNSSDTNTPFDYESADVRWKAQQFEEVWQNEAARLGDKAEQEGRGFDLKIAEGSRQAVAMLATTLRKDSLDKLAAIKAARDSGFWSIDTLTEFGVGMGASLNDPVQVATLGVGAPEAMFGKSILKAGVKEAAVNAGVELLLQPAVQASKLDAGIIEDWQTAVGDGLTNVGMAGALGFVFGAGGKFVDNRLFAPGRERTEAFRALAKDIEAVRFDDAAVQRAVLKMVGDVVEAEGPIQPSASMAEALRDAATKAADPAAAARLNAVAGEVEKALQPPEDPEAKFERARDAMDALGKMAEDNDPESAALVRKALYEAERDFATAKQRPDTVPMDEFADAIEAADARIRALEQFGSRPEPALPEPKTRALDTTDDAPAPEIGAHLREDGKSVTFTRFDPMKLDVAPEEMQYKRFSGEQGVNEAISDIQTWHAPSSGKVLVFERNDGSQVIVDGHQRRERARAISMRDGRTDIRLDGYLYKEADGWTIPELRLKGAQKNIREGRSDVLDTAQALRENPNAIDASFPVSRSNIGQARKLARLSPEAWDLTRAGVLEPNYAALIGAVAPDRPSMHAPLARTLIEAGPENIRQAENILSEALLDYAERDVAQPGLFGDDGLGRGVLYRERAQIMDAAYAALRSDRSVFKALVDNGEIARAIGNELVDQANLTAKDQVELAIAAIMHARRSGTRTAVSDMITRALDSVRREGIAPARAGRQVAREVRALVEERGFRALLDAEGPRPPELSETGPLFDMAGSPAHAAQADGLEAQLRPEGREDPGVDLKKLAEPPDELARLMGDLQAPGNGRPLEEVFDEIRALLKPKAEEDGKPKNVRAEARDELKRLEQADKAVRDAIAPLTDVQKVMLIRMQYPDAYAPLSRLEGPDLDDAIVGRVLAGDIMFGRRGEPGSDVSYEAFNNAALTPSQNKIVEMALNNYTNLDIATELGISLGTVSSEMSRARRVLKPLGIEVPKGITGKTIDGQKPGALKQAIFKMADDGLESAQIHTRLEAEGMPTTIRTVYQYYSMWRSAKAKGTKFAIGDSLDAMGFYSAVQVTAERIPDNIWAMGWDAVQNALAKGRDGIAPKREELNYLGLSRNFNFFANTKLRGPDLKQAVLDHIAANRLVLTERFNRFDPKNPGYEERQALRRWSFRVVSDAGVVPSNWSTEARGAFKPLTADEVIHIYDEARANEIVAGVDLREGIQLEPLGETTSTYRMPLGPEENGVRRGPGDIRLRDQAPVFEWRALLPEGVKGFDTESHWSQHPSNDLGVLVSVRGEERQDSAGRRTLFGGEVQSDLAQRAKAARERRTPNEPIVFERDGLWYVLEDDSWRNEAFGGQWRFFKTEAEARKQASDNQKRIDDLNRTKALGAPLIDETSQWTNVAVRAMVYRAAREDFESVSFPTAETSTRIQGNDNAAGHYDSNVKAALEKIAKQLGGEVRRDAVWVNSAKKFTVRNRASGEEQVFKRRRDAEAYVADNADKQFDIRAGEKASAYVLDITPTMREKIVANGFPLFARGPEGPGLTRETLIETIKAEFGDGANALIRIGEVNIRDVPEPWMAPDTMGFADTRGRVTLIAGNIDPDQVRGIVLHEIGVHTALQRILGDDGKAAILQQIEDRLAAGDASVVAARNRAIRAETPAEDLAEETLAYLVMHAPKHGLVRQLIADIRAWLYRTFSMLRDAFTLTDEDLQSLAMGAVRSRIRAAQQVGQFTAEKTASGAVYGGVKVASPTWNGAVKLRQLLGEPSKYLPWRNNPRFGELAAAAGEAVETVSVGAIVPGQSQIRWNYKDVHKRYGKSDADLPWLVREDGKYYIRDGTHRIAAQVDDGATAVRARVVDLDAAMDADPVRFARGWAIDPNLPGTIPYFPRAGYEARDLILMFNDGFDFSRMGTELTLATGIPANPGSVRVQVTNVRTALRASREDPKLFAETAAAMRVSEDELNAFIDNLGKRRAPSVAAEARRLIREGVTATPEIIKGLKAYAEKHRLDIKTEILDQTISHARNDLGANLRGPNAVSTNDLKYARRQDDLRDREAESASDAGAGNGASGRNAGAGNAGAGAAAARGRPNLRSVQPVGPMASQPLPPTRYVGGDWNERIDLTPEQRAERRQQFREFVDSSVVEYDGSKFPTTWAFKNGKRYEGAMRLVETRRYRIRQTEDMHADWLEVLEPEETGLTAEIHGGEATIHDSNVAFELRSTGIGQKLYMQAIDDMLEAGLVVNSDVSVSVNAVALWKSLRKQGYDVVQRVPDALLEMGDDGQYAHPSASVAVFYIAGKKPRAPDLPATERDVMTSIDEARDLSEHLPKCLKGKRNG